MAKRRNRENGIDLGPHCMAPTKKTNPFPHQSGAMPCMRPVKDVGVHCYQHKNYKDSPGPKKIGVWMAGVTHRTLA